ncbi:MAG: hypothetical protein AB8H80_21630, partial [Planctomycetota bacterium]
QTANSSIGLTVFAVGAHGWVGQGPLPSQDPLTIDPTQPFEAIGATSTSYSWSITPSVMMALRGHSFAASAALLMTSGELRLSTADILAF